MTRVTIELTLDQLVEAIKKLPVEEQLALVHNLLKEVEEESTVNRDKGPGKTQAKSEAGRVLQDLGRENQRLASLASDVWAMGEDDDTELTILGDLHPDEFQA
jgi:hypothetical protein